MSGETRLHANMGEVALKELQRRADSLAQETEEERRDESVALLLFALADEWYAVRVSEVREIYQEYAVTPVPCVPDYILGVVNIRGEIVSVTHLARLMRLQSEITPGEQPAIVLADDGCVTAAVVDEIGDIIEVAKNALEPPVSMVGKAQADYVSGSVYVEDKLVGLLHLGRVLQPVGSAD